MHVRRLAVLALTGAIVLVASFATAMALSPPAHLWSQHFGAQGSSTRGFAITTDPWGNVIVAGSFSGSVGFGGGNLVAEGTDVFLAKYTPAGVHLWSQKFGGAAADQAYAVAVDGEGYIFVTGYFQGIADFGGNALVSQGGNDMFIAKYNSVGDHVWSKTLGTNDADIGYSVATDQAGNAIVTGYLHGVVPSDIFVICYTPSGTSLWTKLIGGPGYDEGLAVAVDEDGNVLLTGSFSGTVNFGGGNLTVPGEDWDAFVAKYDPSGAHLWSRRCGSNDLDAGLAIKSDASGNVIVTGYFTGTADFGGGPVISIGYDVDIFLAKYGPNGTHLWSQRVGGMSYETAYGLAVDSESNIFLAGYFNGTANFGGADLVSAGNIDIFFAEYRPDGTHISSQRFGGTAADAVQSIAVDDAGNRYMTGYFSGTVDFGGTGLISNGTPDALFVKYGAVATAVNSGPTIDAFSLSSIPNPFNPSTTLHYRIPSAGHVTVTIHDVRGQLVTTLVDEDRPAGANTVQWRGRDRTGQVAASGVYFARISHAGDTRTHKLVLLK